VSRRVSQAEVDGLKILTVPERQVVISVDCSGQAVKVEAVTLSECRAQVNMKDFVFVVMRGVKAVAREFR
jgi:hypothetical protein